MITFMRLQLLLLVFGFGCCCCCCCELQLQFPIAYQSRRQLGWRISQSLEAERKKLNSNNSIGDKELCIILFNLRLDTRRSSSFSIFFFFILSWPLVIRSNVRRQQLQLQQQQQQLKLQLQQPHLSTIVIAIVGGKSEIRGWVLPVRAVIRPTCGGHWTAAAAPPHFCTTLAAPPMTEPQWPGDAAEINAVQPSVSHFSTHSHYSRSSAAVRLSGFSGQLPTADGARMRW